MDDFRQLAEADNSKVSPKASSTLAVQVIVSVGIAAVVEISKEVPVYISNH